MGVRRAVELVLDAPAKHRPPICTYGPLIHNPQVLDLLEEKGIGVIDRIPPEGEGTALIRAHGVPPETKKGLESAGSASSTPPAPGYQGPDHHRQTRPPGPRGDHYRDRDHPEVVGLLGYAGDKGCVVDSIDALKDLPPFDQAIIVAQTTQNMEFFGQVKAWAAAHKAPLQGL